MAVRLPLLAVVMTLAVGCAEAGGVDQRSASAEVSAAADKLCGAAVTRWEGRVVRAYPTTVRDARELVADPLGATSARTVPVAGPVTWPAGWQGKQPQDVAAVCYIAALFPKGPPPASDGDLPPVSDRALVVATGGAEPVLVAVGASSSLPPPPALPPD